MFTQEQLAAIEFAAKKTKNQGEVAVYNKIVSDTFLFSQFNGEQLNVIKYIAEECKRQHSGELSVYWMSEAWDYANHNPSEDYTCPCGLYVHWSKYSPNAIHIDDCPHKNGYHIDMNFIEWVGKLVEPYKNQKGFRKVAVGVYNGYEWKEKAPWESIERQLSILIDSFIEGNLDPTHKYAVDEIDQFYYEFEEIHPFVDGNGRSGKIIYNFLHRTLNEPIMPPNFWADEGNTVP